VNIAEQLWQRNYAMTEIEAKSKSGPIDVVFVVVKRNRVKELCRTITELDPKAFYTVEEVKQVGFRQVDPGLVLGRKILGGVGDIVSYPVREGRKFFGKGGDDVKDEG
jgi:hypothetical protein